MDYFVKNDYIVSTEEKVRPGETIVEAHDKRKADSSHTFTILEGGKLMDTPLYPVGQQTMTSLLGRKSLREAATSNDFPNQLREDFKVIMLSAYGTVVDNMLPLHFSVNSTKKEETYAGINKLAKTGKLQQRTAPYMVLTPSDKTTVTITNFMHGAVVEIGEELIMFDKSGEIARLAAELGESVAYERYQLLTENLTAAASTTASGSNLTLTPTNLENMLTTYQTQVADAASNKILAWSADTLVVPSALQWTARRILESAGTPGSANVDINVLKGIMTLVVNPLLDNSATSRYSVTRFYIGRRANANGLIYQNVIGPAPETFTQDARQSQVSDDCFMYDLIRYKARLDYGQGVLDAKIWHRSTT